MIAPTVLFLPEDRPLSLCSAHEAARLHRGYRRPGLVLIATCRELEILYTAHTLLQSSPHSPRRTDRT